MTKRRLLTMAAILTVLGSVVAIKSFIQTTPVAARQAAATSAGATPMSQPPTMKIVPAPVIDTKTKVFVGTGDGSAGSWD